MPSAALSYSKIPQTRAESSSLLEYYAKCSFILFKDIAEAESLSLLECYAECSFILFKDIAEAESSNSAKIHQARGKAK